MSTCAALRRFVTVHTLALVALLPGVALATDEYPDFYATITSVAPDRSTITVSPSKDQSIVVDVRQLGSRPFEEGAFAVDNVVLLHTRRVEGGLVAYGWQQARTGSQDSAFEGVEKRRAEREKEDKGRAAEKK